SAWLSSSTTFGTVYDVLSQQIGAPIEANIDSSATIMRPDSSIWEVHQPGKHYLYTTMAATRGLCDLAAMAKKAGNAADQTHYAMTSQKMNTTLQAAFLDAQMALGGSIEGLSQPGGMMPKYYDGSAAEAFDWNLLGDFSGPIANATLNLLDQLRV